MARSKGRSPERRLAWGRVSGPALALLALVLAGCNTANPSARYYDIPLPPAGDVARTASLLDGTVAVERPSVSGLYSERAIVFARADHPRRQQYGDAYWVESPDRLLQQRLMDAWRERGLADRLVTPAMRQASEWQIAARLLRLHQVGPGESAAGSASAGTTGEAATTPNQAHVAVELVLLRQASNTIFLRERFAVTVPAGQGLASYARATGEAVDRVAADFVEAVAERLNDAG